MTLPNPSTDPVDKLPKRGGVRIFHPTKKNAYEIVVDDTREFTTPQPPCPVCRKIHTHKTYHILLNGEGVAYVSMGVFRGLRRGGMGGLMVDSYVEKPPKQVLGTKAGKIAKLPSRETIIVHTDGGE